MSQLHETVKTLMASGKGILAADESTNTAGKRLASIGMENTEENRKAMRDMLLTTPELNNYVSGVIMYDETLRQSDLTDKPFVETLTEQGIVPGIKVDLGTEPFNGSDVEMQTKGLDDLDERLAEYVKLGAKFTKWRCIYSIQDLPNTPGIWDVPTKYAYPTQELIKHNAQTLAMYAKKCQEHGLVPIVEPEVLMDGEHNIHRSADVTSDVQYAVVEALKEHGVDFAGMILKPNMVVSGYSCSEQAGVDGHTGVKNMTLKGMIENMPYDLGGIAYLSGGQSDENASINLNAISKYLIESDYPWVTTFSYGRALQSAALKAWNGTNKAAGQAELIKRCKCNSAAALGKYSPDMAA